jgi:putative RNA 2'-phosphotransferase
VSRVLRHEPWLHELELDEEGWVPVEALLVAIREADPAWVGVDQVILERMIAESPKRRHEVVEGRVRALYGHSLPGRIRKERGRPPDELFHGTSPAAGCAIAEAGLRPMGRQFVHLSTEREMALQVARRKVPDPLLLRIDAGAAQEAGVPFWVGNELVWLTESVPAEFVSRVRR